MDIYNEAHFRKSEYNTRRHFIKNCISGIGALSLGSMLGGDLIAKNQISKKVKLFFGENASESQNVKLEKAKLFQQTLLDKTIH